MDHLSRGNVTILYVLMMALCFAAGAAPACARRRWLPTGICLGLSIASRIEMLCLIPLVWWVLWDRPNGGKVIRAIVKSTLFSIVVAIGCAPWLLTQLIGNLRAIATVGIAGPPGGTPAWAAVLLQFSIEQGMLALILLAIVGLCLQPKSVLFRRGILAVYALALLIGMMTGFAYGIHQHGPVFIAWLLLAAVLFESVKSRWPIPGMIAILIAIAFPMLQAFRDIKATRAEDDHENSVAWIEQHVPAGSTVYVLDGGLRSLLPTEESATALWTEETDDQAWRKKIEKSVERFHLSTDELPRALSEENLVQERGNRRKWFILGGHTDSPIPRYDIRIVKGSPVFGIQDLNAALKSHGGLALWRDQYDPSVLPVPALGTPLVQWLNADHHGVSIYCSPELRAAIQK